MAARQVGHRLGKQLQRDQEGLQRIVGKLLPARENVVEHAVVLLDVAPHHGPGEFVLVLEMIEEAALGDAGLGDDLLDRRGAEALDEHRRLGDLQDPFARCLSLAHPDPLDYRTNGTVFARSSISPNRPQPPQRQANRLKNRRKSSRPASWTTRLLARLAKNRKTVGIRPRRTTQRPLRTHLMETTSWPSTGTTCRSSKDGIFLSDGGMETTLIFHEGVDLPHFASFVLLETEEAGSICSATTSAICRSRATTGSASCSTAPTGVPIPTGAPSSATTPRRSRRSTWRRSSCWRSCARNGKRRRRRASSAAPSGRAATATRPAGWMPRRPRTITRCRSRPLPGPRPTWCRPTR